jgi:hypothetical protein
MRRGRSTTAWEPGMPITKARDLAVAVDVKFDDSG